MLAVHVFFNNIMEEVCLFIINKLHVFVILQGGVNINDTFTYLFVMVS